MGNTYSSICAFVGSAILGTRIGAPTTTSMDSRFGITPCFPPVMRLHMPPLRFRPYNKGGVTPIKCLHHSWNLRTPPPVGFATWSKMSFSPNANTGTRDAPVFSAIFTKPFRLAKVNVAHPGLASSASAAPPTTIATQAPGHRVRFVTTLRFVTLLL
jgi:hypothetical protein